MTMGTDYSWGGGVWESCLFYEDYNTHPLHGDIPMGNYNTRPTTPGLAPPPPQPTHRQQATGISALQKNALTRIYRLLKTVEKPGARPFSQNNQSGDIVNIVRAASNPNFMLAHSKPTS